MSKTKFVAKWLVRAQEDIEVMELLLKEHGPANPICFHAQQAAEKFLKAFLAYRGKQIRKIHQLDALLMDCITIDATFIELKDDAIALTRFYVGTRYPANVPDFSTRDAAGAIAAAKHIRDVVVAKID